MTPSPELTNERIIANALISQIEVICNERNFTMPEPIKRKIEEFARDMANDLICDLVGIIKAAMEM